MPAGPPSAKGRVPGGAHYFILRPGRLPERKVAGVFLGVFVSTDPLAGAGLELAHVDSRKLPILREPGNGEVDRTVGPLIRNALPQQSLDQRHHLRDVVGGARIGRRLLDPQVLPILVKRIDVMPDIFPERLACLFGAVDRFVVHVGDVHDVKDLVAARLQPAPEEVLEQEGPEVSDVGVVVDRGTTGVERYPARLQRLERLDLAAQGVVEAERHQPAAPLAAAAIASPSAPPLMVTCTRRCWNGLSTDSRAKRLMSRRRNSRATFHCEPGWVLSKVRITTALSVIDSTPSTSTAPSSCRHHLGSVENWAVSSRTTLMIRSTSSL